MTFKIHPVILCGGSGTRLWPLSTPETPKQFLALTSSRSMIEDTAARFETTERLDLDFASLLVVGSKRHTELLSRELPRTQKILEPFGRNSAPAVAAACIARHPQDLILILPADHDIQDVPAFHEALSVASTAAINGAIVTFGIQPSHPATGYGYIKAMGANEGTGALHVDAFVEKPDLETAQQYLDAGSYFWNAGIFLFKADVMLDALQTFAPEVLAGTKSAMMGQSGETIDLDAEAFSETPSISIDYAVMERASNVKVVPVSMGWSDVGGYRALHELLTGSANENYVNGPAHVQNSSGLYVRSEGPTISTDGVSDLVIVATENEVMITSKHNDHAVKQLGKVVQTSRHALGLSQELQEKASNWLWNAFDFWSERAWDPIRGGFVEKLDMSGNPDLKAHRRVRVQARQVFSFAKAIELGWPNETNAKFLTDQGIDFIDKHLRHSDGGWIHIADADGGIVDDTRDLYDHSFIILAGATAFRLTGNEKARRLSEEALAFIDLQMKDDVNRGWLESIPSATPRRSNPHMHLLEAMLAMHEATGEQLALEHAEEIVRLFESKFFNPKNDIMGEFFANDWNPVAQDNDTVFEPGHHYEWASLLRYFEDVSGHDSISWRRRLIRRANRSGLNPQTGFAFNAVRANGTVDNTNSRLWHQLEMFRAFVLHPEVVSRNDCDALLESIFSAFLDQGPKGGWIDEIDDNAKPISASIPASMLYHVITAFELIYAPTR